MKVKSDLRWLAPLFLAMVIISGMVAFILNRAFTTPREFSFTLYAESDGVTKLTVSPLFDVKGLPPKKVEIFPITNFINLSNEAIVVNSDGTTPITIQIPYVVTGLRVYADENEAQCYENDDVFIVPANTIVPRIFTCVNHISKSK